LRRSGGHQDFDVTVKVKPDTHTIESQFRRPGISMYIMHGNPTAALLSHGPQELGLETERHAQTREANGELGTDVDFERHCRVAIFIEERYRESTQQWQLEGNFAKPQQRPRHSQKIYIFLNVEIAYTYFFEQLRLPQEIAGPEGKRPAKWHESEWLWHGFLLASTG
jgi:hypothetical protein